LVPHNRKEFGRPIAHRSRNIRRQRAAFGIRDPERETNALMGHRSTSVSPQSFAGPLSEVASFRFATILAAEVNKSTNKVVRLLKNS
jgi:hypothetical protein